MQAEINIFWFRRDLRLEDNKGLFESLKSGIPVLPIFIFDKNILDKLPSKKDSRVAFIHASIIDIQNKLQTVGSSLEVFHDDPSHVVEH